MSGQETIKVSEVSEAVLKLFEEKGWGNNPEIIRLGLGLTLSSLHSALLIGAQTEEMKREAMQTCMNTIHRLCQSFQRDVEAAGLGRVEIDFGVEPSREPKNVQ